jgi:hypothetical protein
MIRFCEATKVDLQSSFISNTNQNKTHDNTITNTISLVSSLFVDMIDVDMAIESGFLTTRAEIKESFITFENSIIWNGGTSKEQRFLVEPEGYNPSIMTRYQLEQLQLYESWCAFGHNEYTKNLICVLEEVTRRIYGPSATIPNRILGLFLLDQTEIKSPVARQAKLTSKHLPYQFKSGFKDVDDIIIGSGVVARPLQFQLGNFTTMIGIIEKQHPGWDDIDDKTFFHRSEAYKRKEVVMPTTKDYEECFIMFSTMTLIKKTFHNTDKQNNIKIEQSFEIRCAVTNFEVNNDSLRSRHPDIFKNEEFDFCPTNDLIKLMPCDVVNGLVDGKWTILDKKWLKDDKNTLKQAQSHSVKDVELVRTIMKEDITGIDSNLINYNADHIYQVTMDYDAQSMFYVNSDLIMEIFGEEEWMKGEFNCICNIASGRKVTLAWGLKKKLSNRSHLSIGDDVIVSNHGTKWEHRAKIIQMNDDGISVMVKWDTSLKKENVLLKDCKKYDVEITTQRKWKSTNFFAPRAKEEFINEPSLTKHKSSNELALMAGEEIVEESETVEKPFCADGQVENIFFNPNNFSKQFAQGSLANLLHMLKCSKEELDLFWYLAHSDNVILEERLGEPAPKKVKKPI